MILKVVSSERSKVDLADIEDVRRAAQDQAVLF